MNYVEIPDNYRQKIRCNYPAHQRGDLIEEFAFKYFKDKEANGYTYIPVFWTAHHVNHGYGRAKDELIVLLKDLPKGKYFTCCQYDGGTLIDDFLTERGCVTFVGDCRIPHNIIMPLLCDPHPVKINETCQWLCGFAGSFDTHPIRVALKTMYGNTSGFYFGRGDTNLFRNVVRDSTFSLCPRGSGITSFRMYEAIQIGSIPVYVSDIFRKPFENKVNWDEFCITVKLEDIGTIESTLRAIKQPQIDRMRTKCKEVYEKYFNMQGCCDEILEIVRGLK